MAKHSEAVGTELHYPQGHASSGVPLTLTDNTAEAYLIENTGGADILKIDTTNSAELLTIGWPTKVLANDASTAAILVIDQDSTGDAAMRFDCGAAQFLVGIDNSASDEFLVAEGTALGTTNRIGVLPSGGAIGLKTSTLAWGERLRLETVGLQTTDTTATAAWTLAVTEGQMVMIHAWVVAGSSSQAATYDLHGGVRRYTAGSTTVITGTPDEIAIGEEDSTWAVTIDANSNNARVMVTGGTGDVVDWRVTVWYQIVTLP